MIDFEPKSGPFAHTSNSSNRIMYTVVLTLLPAALMGVYQFGIASLQTLGKVRISPRCEIIVL